MAEILPWMLLLSGVAGFNISGVDLKFVSVLENLTLPCTSVYIGAVLKCYRANGIYMALLKYK